MAPAVATEEEALAKDQEKMRRREERQQRKAEQEAAYEKGLMGSRQEHPEIWKNLDALIETIQALPQEEQSGNIELVTRVFGSKLRPGRKAQSKEKMAKKLAKLIAEQAKLLAELGEPSLDA